MESDGFSYLICCKVIVSLFQEDYSSVLVDGAPGDFFPKNCRLQYGSSLSSILFI
jgi:hypothetical protein